MKNVKSHINIKLRFSFRNGFLLFVLISFFWGFGLLKQAVAQDQVNIRNADLIEAGSYEGDRVQKIIGNVHLESEELEMFCDSAYKFVNKDEMRAFGDIQINTESEKIWADTLVYFTDIDFSQLRGRVVIEADTTTLFGNSVDYRFSTKVAHFLDEIRLEDQRGTLLANSGFYYREADSAEFRGEVQLADSMQYLEGDSLFSNRSTDYYELYGDIFGDDRKNNTMIKGHYLESDSTGRRLLKDEAWLKNFESEETDTSRTDTTIAQSDTVVTQVDTTTFRPDSIIMPTDSLIPPDTLISPPDNAIAQTDTTISEPDTTTAQPDTTHIRAETILLEENQSPTDTSSTVHGYGNVRTWSTNFAAVADTSKYVESTQTFELWSNSIAWHDQVQLTGPYIKAILRSGNIDSLVSYPSPFSVQEDTTINRLNQITGDTLQTDFEDGTLSEIYVYKNAHLLRFFKNEQDSADGAVDITAPSIQILFENGEIDTLRAMGLEKAINGSILPESPETAKRRLDGFAWNPDMRPQRPKEKMERRFPPIPNEPFFELPRRYLEYLRKNHPDSPYLIQAETSSQ